MTASHKLPALFITLCTTLSMLLPLVSHADDIDLFVGSSAGTADYPNVLIILDNSSNWSAANQGWPTDTSPPVACGNDCNKQGYYELKSLRSVINALPTNASGDIEMKVGLMMFNNSNSARDGSYVRFHVKQLTAANKASFISKIDTIIQNFNTETAASSVQYEHALWDAFKYFGGFTNPTNATLDQAPSTNPTYNASIPVFGTKFWGSLDGDPTKYDTTAYNGTDFVPVSTTSCGKNFIIFIGNGFPAGSTTNGGVNDTEHVLELLTNPSSPPSSITEFPVTTYSYTCSGTWSNASSYSCGSSASCTTALSSLTNSSSKVYQCAKSNCSGSNRRVQECTTVSTSTSSQVPSGSASGRFGDEFSNFLYKTDVSDITGQQNVITYAIDVYKDQPDDRQKGLMYNMATKAGGKYFAASNESAIVSALQTIFIEIQSVNSTFASASLPINATNRSYNLNQVFIGMFRPDQNASPRWFGNVKQYQIGSISSTGELILKGYGSDDDVVNTTTGFIKDCAVSNWTSDSPNPPGLSNNSGYWSTYDIQPSPAGRCTSTSYSAYSDHPDGPRVEKGAVAEVIRKGNNPPTTDTAPTFQENRTLYSASSSALIDFNTASITDFDYSSAPYNNPTSTNDTRLKWARGQDTQGETGSGGATLSTITNLTRASLHGDVAHSRPLPISYGSSIADTVVYYGANDGWLRAVSADTGKELWAFMPPEFNSKVDRLRTQLPGVCYPNMAGMTYDASGNCLGGSPPYTKRDFFWDGSLGVYQNANNTKVWIYPTMRRGGRMVYALNVTSSSAPSYKWKYGCPNSSDDTGCVGTEAAYMGQSWSTPNVAFIKGYSSSTPVVTFGGGYDACEDTNSKITTQCASTKGNAIFVLDADTGAKLARFPTLRSVVADISYIDLNGDGMPDHAYAADTGGNLYRITFSNYDGTARSSSAWTITLIASTDSSAGRKFLFAPELYGGGGKVFIAIGSGDREHPLLTHYPYTSAVANRLYVYRDCLPNPAPTSSDISTTGKDSLDDPAIMDAAPTDSTATDCKAAATAAAKNLTNCSYTKKGWYKALTNGTGEQTVTSALITGGMVTFSTNRPVPSTEANSCGNALGKAYGYWLNLYTGSGAIGAGASGCGGSASNEFAGGGLPPSPVRGTILIGDTPTNFVIGAVKRDPGASSPIAPQKTTNTNSPPRQKVYTIIKSDN